MLKLTTISDHLTKGRSVRSHALPQNDATLDALTSTAASFGASSDALLQLIGQGHSPGRQTGSVNPHLGEALPRVVGGAGYPTYHA